MRLFLLVLDCVLAAFILVSLQVEHDTALSMQTLLKLDAIKIRMMAASEALQVII